MTLARIALCLTFILASVGCSARVLGVRHADKLAMHQIDRMFDLTDAQEDEFGPQVKAEVERLKRDRLPRVIQKLEDYQRAWDRGPTEADALAVVDEYDAVRVDLANQIGPLAAKFLSSLSAEQIAHLEEELKEGNESSDDLLKKSPEDFVEKRRKNTLKGFEHWLGSLADDQEEKFLALVPPNRAEFVQYREERLASQKAFLDLLKARPGEAAIQAKIVEWTKEPYKMRGTTPEEGQRRRKKMIRILAESHALATAEQRRHAKAEIADLIGDLKDALR